MIFVFSITIFYIKCMDLTTWSTCISIPVFARVNHRSCISFIFTSPLQTRTLWNTMGPACMAPWRFLKPAQQSRCYQCQISDVQNPLLFEDCGRLYQPVYWGLSGRPYQPTSILQPDGPWTPLMWIVYMNRCLAHFGTLYGKQQLIF